MEKKYIVRLTDAERETLREVIKKLKGVVGQGASGADLAESRRRWSELDG